MLKIEPFALERYFARHEFSAKYLLSSSDCESLTLNALLDMADPECLRLWENLTFSYTETFGHPALREAVADIYTGLSTNHILVAAPEECIYLSMQALLEPGDHVICTFPGYQSLYALARSIGCDVSFWKPDEGRGWHFDVAQLKPLMRRDTRMVVVNFPHNPTGFLPDVEAYKTLVELVRRQDAYLFSDEMYRFLEFNGDQTLPAACELYDKAVSLFGLSKSFGLPGLRIGWLASRDLDILRQIIRLRDYTTICNSAPSEILALMAMRNRNTIVELQRARIKTNLKHLDRFISAHQDIFSWHRPLAGSVCFPRMILSDDTPAFCKELVEKAGIMLVPSTLFGYGSRHVRIGFGRDNLSKVLGLFEDYLRGYSNR